MINAYVDGFLAKGYHTEAGGTAIDEEIPGSDGLRLALIGYGYTAAATAHLMSLMYAGGTRTTAAAEAALGQKDLVCAVAPKDPGGNVVAASDIVAYKVADGSWEFNVVASLSDATITFAVNIAKVVPAGAAIRVFGVVGDGARFDLGLPASAVTDRSGVIYAINPFKGDPFYVSVDNGTNAGSINNLLFAYINK